MKKASMNASDKRGLPQNVYVCTGNHKTVLGISDIVQMFRAEFERLGVNAVLTDKLVSGEINVLVDEFSKRERIAMLAAAKRSNPSTKICLVLTEFETVSGGIPSFNQFGGFSNFVLSLYSLVFFKIFENKELRLGGLVTAYSVMLIPFLAFIIAKHCLLRSLGFRKNSFKQLYRSPIYMTMRHAGLSLAAENVDLFFSLHQDITAPKKSCIERENRIVLPTITNAEFLRTYLDMRTLGIFMSGSITQFRMRSFREFCKRFEKKANTAQFKVKSFNGAGNDADCELLFSFHPMQSENWRYISPTRIYRSLNIDYSIPVIPHRFGQHPIEDCCLTQEELLAIDFSNEAELYKLKENIICAVQKYNSICISLNAYSLSNLPSRL